MTCCSRLAISAVTDPGFGEAFRAKFGKNEGDSLPIKVRRGTDTLTLHGKVRLVARVESGIEANPAAAREGSPHPHRDRRRQDGIGYRLEPLRAEIRITGVSV